MYGELFASCLAAVLGVLDVRVLLALVLVGVSLSDASLLRRVDWGLLATFAALFVFVGNMGRVPVLHEALSAAVGGNALLEHRQYTKPATWRGMAVPDILLSGDHGKVDRFRRDEALSRTDEIRPDLIERLDCRALDKADRKTLMALDWEVSGDHPRRLD